MPNLIPRDVHHLWLQKNQVERANIKKNNDDETTTITTITTTNYAPPLSSYSSERPGALILDGKSNEDFYSNDLIQNDIQIKLRQLKSIRTLGYSYLTPLGIGKTMETLDEELQIRRQMEQQLESEPATAENLLGEANDLRNEEEQIQSPQTQQPEIQRTPQPEIVNFDDEIPEAEENSYSLAYDDEEDLEPVNDANEFESQYDRGFMVTEQFESQEINEEDDIPQQHAQFITPTRHELSNSNTSEQVGRFVQNNLRNLSGSTSFNTTDNSFDNVNASINESDLDMTIDD